MVHVVDFMDEVIQNHQNETVLEAIAGKVNDLMSGRPLFKN